MTPDLLLFQRFISREAAQDVVALLAASGITGQVVADGSIADGITTFQPQPAALLLLRGADFGRAREVLREAVAAQAATVTDDHYLFTFTDEELRDVLTKPDEWSALDGALAQRILRERGRELPAAAVKALAAKRIETLAEPLEVPPFHLVLGYVSVVGGGLLGVLFGLYLMTSLTTLPNGSRVPAYVVSARRHGRVLVVLGAVVFVGVLLKALFGTGG